MPSFEKLAPHLANPLVLIGFALFLLFSIHRLLIRSSIIPPVAQTDAPGIIKLILRYGFWTALLIIVLGFVYAISRTYVSTAFRHEPRLSVADFSVEGRNLTFDVKLKNSGTDSAFVTEVRLVFFPGTASDRYCMPIAIPVYVFPFIVSRGDDSVFAGQGLELKNYPVPPSALDELRGKSIPSPLPGPVRQVDPYWITPPLRVSQKVPPQDVDAFRISLAVMEHDLYHSALPFVAKSEGCGWTVRYFAKAILYYDGGRTLVTPAFFISLYENYTEVGLAREESR